MLSLCVLRSHEQKKCEEREKRERKKANFCFWGSKKQKKAEKAETNETEKREKKIFLQKRDKNSPLSLDPPTIGSVGVLQ